MTRPFRLPATKWEIIITFEDGRDPMTMNFGSQKAASEFRAHRSRVKGDKISQPREVYSK